MTLVEMMQSSARKYSGDLCLLFNDRRLTYAGLNQSAQQIAAGLCRIGLAPGDRAGVLLTNCYEYVPILFGIWLAGGVAVPINSFLHPREVEFILSDCGAKFLFCAGQYGEHVPAWRNIESLKQIITLQDGIPHTIDLVELTKNLSENAVAPGFIPGKINGGQAPALQQPPAANDLAVIIYTSGTTGHPKGAMLTHENITSDIQACVKAIPVSSRDKFLVFLPLFHSFTLTVTVLLPIFLGAKIILLEAIQRDKIKAGITKYRPTIFVGIPTVYQLLAQAKLVWWQRWLNPIRLYISGGAPLPVETIHKFKANFRRPLMEGYGLSEASPVVSINPIGKTKPGSVGLPLPGVQTRVADEAGNTLETGQVGELLVKGPNIMQGYLNRPEATQAAIKDGWLYTGDLARIDADGYIFIVDRKKDMLIVHGQNVYPREIEEVIVRHPQVAEAAVIGIPDPSRGEVPKAFVTLKPEATVTVLEIKQLCRQNLAAYKVPHVVEIVKELPKTSTGKILKRQLA